MSFEKESEEIWKRWEKGELTHEQVQRELDLIVGVQPKGFFVKLEDNLRGLINQEFPDKTKETLHALEYFKRRDEAKKKLIKSINWSSFWQFHANMLNAPSNKELEHLKQMSNHQLADYFKLVCISLKQLVNNNLEHSEQAQILHEYYKLIKNEINSRGFVKLPERDAFIEYCQNKKQYKEELEKMERARESGSMCPYCDSTNVRSYGKAEWKCHDCGKRFRKR